MASTPDSRSDQELENEAQAIRGRSRTLDRQQQVDALLDLQTRLEATSERHQALRSEITHTLLRFEQGHRLARRLDFRLTNLDIDAERARAYRAQAEAHRGDAEAVKLKLKPLAAEYRKLDTRLGQLKRQLARQSASQLPPAPAYRVRANHPAVARAPKPLRILILEAGDTPRARQDWGGAIATIKRLSIPGIEPIAYQDALAALTRFGRVDTRRFTEHEKISIGRAVEADAVLTLSRHRRSGSATRVTVTDPKSGLRLAERFIPSRTRPHQVKAVLRMSLTQAKAVLRQAPDGRRVVIVHPIEVQTPIAGADGVMGEPVRQLLQLRLSDRGFLAVPKSHLDALESRAEYKPLAASIRERAAQLIGTLSFERDSGPYTLELTLAGLGRGDRAQTRSGTHTSTSLAELGKTTLDGLRLWPLAHAQPGVTDYTDYMTALSFQAQASAWAHHRVPLRPILFYQMAWDLTERSEVRKSLGGSWLAGLRTRRWREALSPELQDRLVRRAVHAGCDAHFKRTFVTLLTDRQNGVDAAFTADLMPTFQADGDGLGSDDLVRLIDEADRLSVAREAWPSGNPGPAAYLNRVKVLTKTGAPQAQHQDALLDLACAALSLPAVDYARDGRQANALSSLQDMLQVSIPRGLYGLTHQRAEPMARALLTSDLPAVWMAGALILIDNPAAPDRRELARRVAIQYAHNRPDDPLAELWYPAMYNKLPEASWAAFATTLAGHFETDPARLLRRDAYALGAFVEHLPLADVGGVYRQLQALKPTLPKELRPSAERLLTRLEPRYWEAEPKQAPPDSTEFWQIRVIERLKTGDRTQPLAVDVMYAESFRDRPEGMLLLLRDATPDTRPGQPAPPVTLKVGWMPVHGGPIQILGEARTHQPRYDLFRHQDNLYCVAANEIVVFTPDGVRRLPHPEPQAGPIRNAGLVKHQLLLHYGDRIGWLDVLTNRFRLINKPNPAEHRHALDGHPVSLFAIHSGRYNQSLLAIIGGSFLYRFDPDRVEPQRVSGKTDAIFNTLGQLAMRSSGGRVHLIDQTDPAQTTVLTTPVRDLHPLWPAWLGSAQPAVELSDGTLVISHFATLHIFTPQGEYGRFIDQGYNRIIPRGPHPPMFFNTSSRFWYHHFLEVVPKLPEHLM